MTDKQAVFGGNLRRLRIDREWSQEKLAEKADTSLRYIQFLEAGKRNPSLQILMKLRRGLNCSFEDLLKGLH